MAAHIAQSDAKDVMPSEATKAVIDAVYQRIGHKEPVGDSRRHPRRMWRTQLDVYIGLQQSGEPERQAVRVATADLSRNGFGFFYRNMIHEGTRVRVCFGMLPDRPMLTGTVRHCRHIGGARHHVGVQFD